MVVYIPQSSIWIGFFLTNHPFWVPPWGYAEALYNLWKAKVAATAGIWFIRFTRIAGFNHETMSIFDVHTYVYIYIYM